MARKLLSPNLESLKILYVEDDQETRDEVSLILRLSFADLAIASNGVEGLELYQRFKPAIVITDILMPEMNGLDMSAAIKQINPTQDIILISAYIDVEYLVKTLEMGIGNYISKPIKIDRLIGKISEINAKILAEQEFLRNRKLLTQYKQLVDETAVVLKFNLHGLICYINQHFCNLFGYTEAELLGQNIYSVFASDEQDEFFQNMFTTLQTMRKWQGVLRKCSKSGDIITVDVTAVTIEDDNGYIEEYVTLMVDMTEIYAKFERLSLNLENDLVQQKHLLREYERAINLGSSLCILNPEGVIVSVNVNFSNSLNYQISDLVGRSIYDLINNSSAFKDRIIQKTLTDGYNSCLTQLKGNDGQERTFSLILVAMYDLGGNIYSLMLLSQDITESIRLNNEIIETQKELIYIMGDIVENRSQETGMHIRRVAQISELLALKYGLSEEHAKMIKITAPMHDIGKIGIPDAILHKHGKLSEQEYAVMRTHANLGFDLLNRLDKPLIQMAAKIAREHHEHYDGQGYPQGIKGENISIESRIVSIVDVVDALGSKRAYKEPWPDHKIEAYVLSKKGTQFDPDLVDILLQNFDEIKRIRAEFQDSY